MDLLHRSRTRRAAGWRATLAAPLAVLTVLAGACSSDSPSTSAKAPTGAKENTASATVCHDLYNGGQLACALNTIGPGGGVVFYDAGSPQSWGRFLEAAPWNWNPSVTAGYAANCDGGCGAEARSILKPIENKTQDRSVTDTSSGEIKDDGVQLCTELAYNVYSGLYPKLTITSTGTAIGSGATATAALLGDESCAGSKPKAGAVQLAHSYRGGGLDDWFIPSKDELVELCHFGNRNGIGGFNANGWYASSSILSSDWTAWRVGFDNCGTDKQKAETSGPSNPVYKARAIRAFS